MPSLRFACVICGLFALGPLAGCSESHDEGHEHEAEKEGNATGSTCPTDSALTYETFGRAFMESYCTNCHSSTLVGAARNDAPTDHNFDSLEEIRATEPEHLDEEAAAGPDAINTEMPPAGHSAPSEQERRQLGEWLACGTP